MPAVGLLLMFIAVLFTAIKTGFIRFGSDVKALLAEKDKQIMALTAERDRWEATALDAMKAARTLSETNKAAVASTTAVVRRLAPRKGRADPDGPADEDPG